MIRFLHFSGKSPQIINKKYQMYMAMNTRLWYCQTMGEYKCYHLILKGNIKEDLPSTVIEVFMVANIGELWLENKSVFLNFKTRENRIRGKSIYCILHVMLHMRKVAWIWVTTSLTCFNIQKNREWAKRILHLFHEDEEIFHNHDFTHKVQTSFSSKSEQFYENPMKALLHRCENCFGILEIKM